MKSAPSSLARRLKDSTFLIVVFVILLAAATAGAAKLITGKDIANHSITGKDIKKKSLPLSVLKTTPKGTPGPKGAQGAKGETGTKGAQGQIGPEGPEGPEGAFSVTFVGTLSSEIAATIAPGTAPKFLGEPEELELFVGDRGAIDVTVTVGTTDPEIDDEEKFALAICFQEEGEPIEVLAEGEEFGVSPTIRQNERTAVTVGSGFALNGEPEFEEPPLFLLLGPCVLNETTSDLDENGRVQGSFWVSSF
jgi:hypothetical protein